MDKQRARERNEGESEDELDQPSEVVADNGSEESQEKEKVSARKLNMMQKASKAVEKKKAAEKEK